MSNRKPKLQPYEVCFYDRPLRVWVYFCTDDEGNQISACGYGMTPQDAKEEYFAGRSPINEVAA